MADRYGISEQEWLATSPNIRAFIEARENDLRGLKQENYILTKKLCVLSQELTSSSERRIGNLRNLPTSPAVVSSDNSLRSARYLSVPKLIFEEYLHAYRSAMLDLDAEFLLILEQIAESMVSSLGSGGKLLVFGNGGSAAQADHLVAELSGRFRRTRPALAAISLTSSLATLTAIGNDFGFEQIFSRQCEAFGRVGDMAIGITTSGRSENVLLALERCRHLGITTVALTGSAGLRRDVAEFVAASPSTDAAIVQELHSLQLHMLSSVVDEVLFGQPNEAK